jgi:3-oxoadipate enol-lactonase
MITTNTHLTEHTIERPGCTIQYWLGGREDRPLVALLHGATMDHHMFDPQVAVLAELYRVLTWDSRGHGKSRPLYRDFSLTDSADDLVALLDHLGVERAVLVGQSMGGMIAQQVYLHHPERVQALVNLGAVNITFPYARWEIWALKLSLPLFNLWPFGHFKRTVAKSTSIKRDVQAYALAAINQLMRDEFLHIWKDVTMAVDEKGIPDHHITVPFLLTHGDQDTTGSIRRQAPKWAAYEPNAEYVVIPDAGHNANQDNPTFFNRVLLGFLQGISGNGRDE